MKACVPPKEHPAPPKRGPSQRQVFHQEERLRRGRSPIRHRRGRPAVDSSALVGNIWRPNIHDCQGERIAESEADRRSDLGAQKEHYFPMEEE